MGSSLWDDADMQTKLETEPDGCWVLWETGPAGWQVAAEGRWWPWGKLIQLRRWAARLPAR
jgi:hypothetical protein